MQKITQTQLPVKVFGIVTAGVLILSLAWDSSNGFGGSEIFTGIALLLVVGAILYLFRMENISEREVLLRIRGEFSPEAQAEALKSYQHLKTKELEGLFTKILDEANGDLGKVKQLSSVAESVGWKAFINNHY